MARTCPGCDKPMIDGQVFNGLLQCHWDCTQATRAKMGDEAADEHIQSRIDRRLIMDGIQPSHRLWKTLGGS